MCKNLSKILPLAFMLLILVGAAPFKDKERQKIFKLYSAGEYQQVVDPLKELISADTAAFFAMDYFMLADIYLRDGFADSAGQLLDLALARSAKASDSLLQKRNAEFFGSLQKQLKNKRTSFDVPPLKPFESYIVRKVDSTAVLSQPDTTKKDSAAVDSLKILTSQPDTSVDTFDIEVPIPFQPLDSVIIAEKKNFLVEPSIVGGEDSLRTMMKINQLFPPTASAAGIDKGEVVIEVTVDTSGTASGFNIISANPPNLGFEAAAIDLMRSMRYIPAEDESGKTQAVLQQTLIFMKNDN